MMAANYFLKHITKLHPGWVGVCGGGGGVAARRPSVEYYKECSIFRKAKGAREARKETLTLELNANVIISLIFLNKAHV